MAPPGRRRHAYTSPSSIILTLILIFTTSASAAVLGVDFGTAHIKAALVGPGTPFEIVLTKDSKRKEVAAVAFKPTRDGNKILAELGAFPERLYGADALALQGRFPGEVFPNLKPLLALGAADGLQLTTYNWKYPAVQLSQDDQPTIRSNAFVNSEASWNVEELLAMEFANIKKNAKATAGKGVSVDNVVFTVPAFYTAQEKAAISRAADMADMNVMGLITDGLAVGLDYAKSRTFGSVTKGEKPEHHIVYDMGAGSTTATVLRFQGRDVKDVGRFNKTIQEVSVLGVGWDRELGGDAFTRTIMLDYIHKFLTKPVMKSRGVQFEEVQQNGRVISRLWKDAEKAKTVLSANTQTTSSFEELLPDIDFKTTLTRMEYEALTAIYADRVTKPIEDALIAAGLAISDINSIILHGGAVRTPFVQKKLEELAGAAKLKTNVNADESAVMGAAFRAATLSPSFKVKEIRFSDAAGYASGITYPTETGKQLSQLVFSNTSLVGNNGTTKQISFKQKDDFAFQLYQKINDKEVPFALITTQNLTTSVKALKDNFSCDKDDVSTKFSVRLNPAYGLVEAVVGTVSCETDAAKSSVGDSVKDWLGLGKKKDQAPLDDDETGPTEDVTASEDGTAVPSTIPTKAAEKKRTEFVNIAFTTTFFGEPAPEEKNRRVERLSAFDRSDTARLAKDEAANVLEGYTYYVKDFLTNTDYSSFSTEAQRAALSQVLDATREFMDTPAEVAKATEKVFREKLAGLKDLVTPILIRRTENEGRPAKLEALRSSLEQTDTFISRIAEQVEKARDAASSSIAKASESAASLVEKVAGKDELDDLEEHDTTAPEETKMTDIISQYTNDDVEAIRKVYEEVKSWLAGKEEEQQKVSLFQDPAYTIKELEQQASLVSDAMMRLIQKKIRTPSKAAKKAKTSKTKAPKKSKSTDSAESSITDAPGPEESILNKARFMTIEDGDEMPSEEDILQMVKDAKAAGSAKTTSSKDEL